jgi:hypothetical protein
MAVKMDHSDRSINLVKGPQDGQHLFTGNVARPNANIQGKKKSIWESKVRKKIEDESKAN